MGFKVKRRGGSGGPIGQRDWIDPDGRRLTQGTLVIQTPDECTWLENMLRDVVGTVAVDTEFRGCSLEDEHPYGLARATSVQLTTREFPRIYLDNYAEYEGNIEAIRKWALDGTKPKTGHYFTVDAHCLHNHFGKEPRGLFADTLGLDWLRDTSREGQHGLKTAAEFYLGRQTQDYSETFKRAKVKKNGELSKVEELIPHWQWWDEGYKCKVVNYACEDPVYTLDLMDCHQAHLEQIPWARKESYWHYYREFEVPFQEVLYRMERRGLLIDSSYMEELQEYLGELQIEKGKEFYAGLVEAGIPTAYLEGSPPKFKDRFNPNSSQQLADLLFNQLGLPPVKETSRNSGRWSTDSETLEYLEGQFPVLGPFMDGRKIGKLLSTYTRPLLESASKFKGYIHTILRQLTQTGRLSSAHPNFQNVPVRSELGRLIRRCFVAPPGMTIVDADYDQIEVKIAAHNSQDPTMLADIRAGIDAHSRSAYIVVDAVREWVDANGGPTKENLKAVKAMFEAMRAKAKTLNFSVQYGAGAMRAASIFGVSEEEGQAFIDKFFGGYPGFKRYVDDQARFVNQNGHVRTLLRRYCHFPPASGSSFGMRKAMERRAVNYPIQGGARDIIMLAMLLFDTPHGGKAYERLMELGVELRMQVHDELMWYCPDDEATKKEVEGIIQPLMSEPYQHFGFRPLSVPTTASVQFAHNWAEAH